MLEAAQADRGLIYAKVIADSFQRADPHPSRRLTTFEVQFQRWLLPEFNTHRRFSRNSGSSRAVPVIKTLRNIAMTPAMPIVWGSEKPGMQSGPPLTGGDLEDAKRLFYDVMEFVTSKVAQYVAEHPLDEEGSVRLHKSLLNRLLEPFMWHKVIVTSAEWDNFWVQRDSPLAMPEMEILAKAMREAYDASSPLPVDADGWHLPYIDIERDAAAIEGRASELTLPFIEVAKRVSVARCARVSYLTHDGEIDVDADLNLFSNLVTASPPHWSPLEHVARPAAPSESVVGNFAIGRWVQLRHDL